MLTTSHTRDRDKVEVEQRKALGDRAHDVIQIQEVMTRNIDGDQVVSHIRVTIVQSEHRVEVVYP